MTQFIVSPKSTSPLFACLTSEAEFLLADTHTIDIPMTCAFPADVDQCNSLKLRIILLADGWIKTKRNIPGTRIWLNVSVSPRREEFLASHPTVWFWQLSFIVWSEETLWNLTLSQKTQEWDFCQFNVHNDMKGLLLVLRAKFDMLEDIRTHCVYNGNHDHFGIFASTLVTQKWISKSLMLPQLGHSSIRYFQFWYNYSVRKLKYHITVLVPPNTIQSQVLYTPIPKARRTPFHHKVWKGLWNHNALNGSDTQMLNIQIHQSTKNAAVLFQKKVTRDS